MKSAAFTVTIRATSITISPGNASVELLHPLLSLFEYEEIISPRNEDQQDVIDFIAGTKGHIQNIDARQLFLVKQPGFG